MNTLDKVYDLTIDIKNIDVKYNSYAKFFDDDRETSVIRIKLLNDKTPIDLEGCTVEAEFILANNTYHDETCKIINSSEGVVELQLCQKCLVKGENIVRLSILKDNEISNTPVITYEVKKGLYSDNPNFNDDPLTPVLSQMLLDVKVTKANQIELQERYEKSLPKIEGKIKEVESLINRVDTAIASGTQDLEVKEARVDKNGTSYSKLGDRLDSVDSQLEHIENKIEKQFINVDDFGAIGDGFADDTEAIQKAIDYAYNNNISTVVFSNKTYAIKGIDETNVTGLQNGSDLKKCGIQFKTGVSLEGMSKDKTIIKVLPNSHERYLVFNIDNCKNIKISNMCLTGDKELHNGTSGEWGHGIICTMSQNITFENLKVIDMWGDGIYVGLDNSTNIKANDIPKNILIKNVEIDNVSRNGLSLCTVDGMYIDNLVCKNINRTFPKSAIDIEAEGWAFGYEAVLKNIRINNLYVENCSRGIDIYTQKTNIDYDIEINNFSTFNCGQSILCEDAQDNTGHIKFNNCYFRNTRFNSLYILNKSASYSLTINGLDILNNGKFTANSSPTSIIDMSAICITCNKDMTKDNGNIKINNLRIYNDNDILCRRPIYISRLNKGVISASNGYKFKDICISNINEYTAFNEGANGTAYMFRKYADFENVYIDDAKFIYDGTYNTPYLSTVIDNFSTFSDNGLDSRLIFRMDDVADTSYEGKEITFKKSNPKTNEMVINTVEKKILGINNPNENNYLYTDQNGSELKMKLIDNEWYIIDIKGKWTYRGGL